MALATLITVLNSLSDALPRAVSDRSAGSLVFCVDTLNHEGKVLEASDSSEDAVWKIYHNMLSSL